MTDRAGQTGDTNVPQDGGRALAPVPAPDPHGTPEVRALVDAICRVAVAAALRDLAAETAKQREAEREKTEPTT